MSTTANIGYRNAAHKAAHQAAATAAGVTLSEWLRAAWEHYSGGDAMPAAYVSRYDARSVAKIHSEPANQINLAVRGVSDAAARRQHAAAVAARMKVGGWRVLVADVAAGVSDLDRQLGCG